MLTEREIHAVENDLTDRVRVLLCADWRILTAQVDELQKQLAFQNQEAVHFTQEVDRRLAALTAERDSESRWAKHYCDQMVSAQKVIQAMVKYYDVDLLEMPFGDQAIAVLNETATRELPC